MPSIKLEPIDVPCHTCYAQPGEPCDGVKTFHRPRRDHARDLTARTTGNSSAARWWRWRIRNAGVPRIPQPEGTVASYRRAMAAGREPTQADIDAARAAWREQRALRRQRARERGEVLT